MIAHLTTNKTTNFSIKVLNHLKKFKKNFRIKKESQKTFMMGVKTFIILVLTVTRNNVHCCIFNPKIAKILYHTNAGNRATGLWGTLKSKDVAYKELGKIISEKLLHFNINCVSLKFKGPGKYRRHFLNILMQEHPKLKIAYIFNDASIPHNGCRAIVRRRK